MPFTTMSMGAKYAVGLGAVTVANGVLMHQPKPINLATDPNFKYKPGYGMPNCNSIFTNPVSIFRMRKDLQQEGYGAWWDK